MKREYYVYLLANSNNNVLYVGVTNDLIRRVFEHRNHLVTGFTDKYNVFKLVYFEQTEDVESAILREKQLKSGSRLKKKKLIEINNSEYKDLYDELV